MKKINFVLTMIVAVLLFQMISSSFNQEYHLSEYDFSSQDRTDDMRVVSLSVSTETFKGSQEDFVEKLTSYLNEIPYDASVLSVGATDGHEEAVDILYVKPNDNLYSHLYIKGNMHDNRVQEKYLEPFMTNYDNENVQIIQPFRFNRDIYYDGLKNKLEYKSIDVLNEMVGNAKDFIINLNFYVPLDEILAFQKNLETDYFNKYYNCEEASSFDRICGLNISSETPVDIRNFEWSLFDQDVNYPLFIMLVSCISLITLIIYRQIQNEKEIVVRKMHGNSDWIIFLRLVFPLIVQTLLVFVSTLILFFFITYEGPYLLLKSLFLTLLKVSFVFLICIVVLIFGLACIQRLTNKGLSLKKNRRSPLIYIGNNILKIAVIVFLSIPLVSDGEDVLGRRSYLRELSNMTQNYDQVISSVNYGYEYSYDDENRMNQQLFKIATENDVAYMSFQDVSRNLENPDTPVPIAINKVAFQILFPQIQVTNQENDFIDITSKQGQNPYISSDAICLDETPQITTAFFTGGVVKNPSYRLVLKPTNEDLEMIGFMSLYTLKDNHTNLNGFIEQVSKEITSPEVLKLEAIQKSSQKVLTRTVYELIMKLSVMFLLIFVYSKLLVGLYLNNNGKKLTIQYLHGLSRFERFFRVYMIHTLTIFISSRLTIHFLLKEIDGLMLARSSFVRVYFVVILGFDLLMVNLQLRKFERKSVIVLKGEHS
ncbi:hypothetical protein ERUR111494_03515 [Erysipelothrix urinaevulpis]|uniref:hypothetical protein n=1 Tax=Erysipelothrix urinaevulpis TaxID=2683717 RepID=UPI00135B1E17|nr:hypothetical protein [Erysipelothrix urinaevulpis]